MTDLYKTYGPGRVGSEEYMEATRAAAKTVSRYLNDEIYSTYSPAVVMNALSSVFIQMLVAANVDLDEFIPLMVEAVSDCREHMRKLEGENASGET